MRTSLPKHGSTTSSLHGSVISYGKDSSNIAQMMHIRNYIEKTPKNQLGDPTSLGLSLYTYGSIPMNEHRRCLVTNCTAYNFFLVMHLIVVVNVFFLNLFDTLREQLGMKITIVESFTRTHKIHDKEDGSWGLIRNHKKDK